MKKSIILLIVTVIFVSCATEKEFSDIPIINKSVCEKVETIKLDDPKFFVQTELVQLETTDNSLLSEIYQMEIFENHIYIFDKKMKSIKKFDLKGKYIQDIGALGNGPGEYLSINAFYIHPQHQVINIFDPLKQSVHRYGLSGNFIESIKFEDKNIAFISRASLLNQNDIFCFSTTNWEDNGNFFILKEKDYSISHYLSYHPVKPKGYISFSVADHPYTVTSDGVRFVSLFSDTIRSYHEDEITGLAILKGDRIPLDSHTIKKLASDTKNDYFSILRQVSDGKKYTLGLKNYFESNTYFCCNFFSDNLLNHAILWNKTNSMGIYISDYANPTPDFGSISYCFKNTFVRIWDGEEIEYFKEKTSEGLYDKNQFPQKVWEAIDNYESEDSNPVLIFYTLKE
ncbi:hypothetical protein AGMMS50239_23330 [Bacteroidia bacterium]|nr:hypothetical protein AGMMS50239_23330 [Bacteroidia bacterium]